MTLKVSHYGECIAQAWTMTMDHEPEVKPNWIRVVYGRWRDFIKFDLLT